MDGGSITYGAAMGLPWVVAEGTKPRKMAMEKNRIISTLVISVFVVLGPQPAGCKSAGLQQTLISTFFLLWCPTLGLSLISSASHSHRPLVLKSTQNIKSGANIFIVQVKKLRPREGERLSTGHTVKQ